MSGLFQVRCSFRAVASVANCVLVTPVVRWFRNGSSGWLEVISGDLTLIFAAGGAVI